jgi:hypothetical protein
LLEIVVDTRRQLYLLSVKKLRNIASAARLFRQSCIRRKRRFSLRELQRFCGLANSAYLAVTDARFYFSGSFQLFKRSHVKPPSNTVPPKLKRFDLVVQPA